MSELVANCPRCGTSHVTFDVRGHVYFKTEYGWKHRFEVFAVCRRCLRGTIFIIALHDSRTTFERDTDLTKGDFVLNHFFSVEDHVSLRHSVSRVPPDHLPQNMLLAFSEGATCLALGCYNAAACMFRLCVDLATKPLLPDPEDKSVAQPNAKQRRDLGSRLPWLFEHKLLPADLHDLANCIKEDGNEGAHVGSIGEDDAEDLIDFADALLDRLITQPARIEAKKTAQAERRTERSTKRTA